MPDLKPPHADSHAAYLARRHFANLDGLRFICIMMVLWHHYQLFKIPALPLLERGFLGVDFFFVLSGYLITTLLLRERARNGEFSLRAFWWRRFLRIVPLYYFVVSGVAFYYIVLQGRDELAGLLPYYYGFLSNFLTDHIPLLSITWSLSVEEQFYLLWPLLLLAFPLRLAAGIAAALVVANVGLAVAGIKVFADPRGPMLLSMPNATYAPILLGALLAVAMDDRRGYGHLRRVLGWRLAAPVGLAALAVAIQIAPTDIRGWPNLAIHLLMTASLAALVLREDGALSRLLQVGWVARIGVVSYGIYLYHLIALDLATRALPPGLPRFALYLLLSWLIAELSYRTLEAWFRQLRPAGPARRTDASA